MGSRALRGDIMSNYTLSIVLLIPEQHKQAINDLAEASGYGPDCLSAPLIHTDGSAWTGCHTWAAPEFLEDLGAADPSEALAALVMSVRSAGQLDDEGEPLSMEPLTHWAEALTANNLSRVEP